MDELTTAARESSMPAVVLQQQREPQRSRTPLSRQQLPILIQQGPELDQLINVNLGWLHAGQSLPDPTMSGPLRLVTAPLPAPRLGRNLRDLIDIVTTLESRGVGVQSLTNGIVDTTTAHGKLVFGMFALMAE